MRSVIFFMLLVGLTQASQWAMLVAGSNSWYNVRHQADVCHAYQILHKNGLPDSNVVTFMFDDVAYSAQNPTPGIIINLPNGPDVYEGVVKDYTHGRVTVDNFLRAMMGKHTDGKVLNTTAEDDIFVYLADHGGSGLFCFPNQSDPLYAHQLFDAIEYMHNHSRYRHMVIYMESCESGSMFAPYSKQLAQMNVYAVSASSPEEPSYACSYDPFRSAYLSDCFSINWLENSESADSALESVLGQFLAVKNETTTSTVCQFGSPLVARLPLKDFQDVDPDEPREKYTPIRGSAGSAVRADRAELAAMLKMLEKALMADLPDIDLPTVRQLWSDIAGDLASIEATRSAHRVWGPGKCLSSEKVERWVKNNRRATPYHLEALKFAYDW